MICALDVMVAHCLARNSSLRMGGLMDLLSDISSIWIWVAVTIIGVVGFLMTGRASPREAEAASPAPPPPPERPQTHVPVATSDGRKTAEYILCAPNLDKARELYDFFKAKIPAEDRTSDHFVNKAYMRRLEKGGDADGADAFYRDVAFNDPDNIRDDLEFAEIVGHAEGKLIEKARRYLSSEIERMEWYRDSFFVHFPPAPDGFHKELGEMKFELRGLEDYIERLNDAR